MLVHKQHRGAPNVGIVNQLDHSESAGRAA
jgi:hypothetical protein